MSEDSEREAEEVEAEDIEESDEGGSVSIQEIETFVKRTQLWEQLLEGKIGMEEAKKQLTRGERRSPKRTDGKKRKVGKQVQ
ncbi:hypothetical protein HS1genome_0313 [Sulfodiicoccus acidiphilus]|uniref:RNA polymerase Rpo13 subunit HTH domain-containing protein n=1 Tax=Sulfodiicoccus acidiphilus TaxID=1670455 RepID=A0A348B172_9CREN|nr:RNA polymerase subunit Rpo13 [Sulfodiicoccus acidiphilus]BBD71924.1 hypothetical protein HS1genome_0313 [Sulfodiicoccus acidiphilus]GGT91491.1 hypothetical protein GCM10007116_06510 [Sulfodiicoccus acidiphilus]